MPTYEYRCPNGHQFDLFQKMSEEPGAQCPECGQDSERILSGGAGFLFKGDGFYITDYRSESYKKEASKETSSPAEPAGGEASPKPEKKKPPTPAKSTGPSPSKGD
jgi:putative FmdB family regulatory protein